MPLSNQRGRLRALPIERHEIDFGKGVSLRDGLISMAVICLQATNVDLSQARIVRVSAPQRSARRPPTRELLLLRADAGTFGTYYAVCEARGKVYSSPGSISGPYALAAGTPPTMATSGYEQGMATDMIEFNGVILFITTRGLYSYDGTTWTLVTSAVVGTSITVWQNKIWVAGVGSRVYFSKAGDHTTWDALDYVDIREGGANTPVLGLHATHDMDIQGRPSLLAYKGQYGPGSVYRINDPTTGAFTTLSAAVGPIHKRAIASNDRLCVFIAANGIYATSGASVPEKISAEIDQLFKPGHNAGTPAGTSLRRASFQGRFIFSFPGKDIYTGGFLTGTALPCIVDWDPETGAFVVHQWPQFGGGGGGSQGALRLMSPTRLRTFSLRAASTGLSSIHNPAQQGCCGRCGHRQQGGHSDAVSRARGRQAFPHPPHEDGRPAAEHLGWRSVHVARPQGRIDQRHVDTHAHDRLVGADAL
jgi:hypothetical protein